MAKKIQLGQRLKVCHLTWTDNDLQAIIEQRLRYFSANRARPYKRLAELSPEIDDLDARLIKIANGNPRDLILLCDYLILEHCRQPITNDNLYFTETDLALAIKRLDNYRGSKQDVTSTPYSPIDSLPTLLSVLIARYDDEQNITDKLWNAFHLTQSTLQFVACILLVLYKQFGETDSTVDEKVRELLFDVQRPPSLGDWNQVLNRVTKLGRSFNTKQVEAIMQFRAHKKLSQALETLISTRNDVAHSRTTPNAKSLSEIHECIEIMLMALKQISLQELVSIEDFDISEHGKVIHNVRIHKGNVLIPKRQAKIFEKNYQRNRIVWHSPESQTSVDLGPFFIFESSSESGSAGEREIYFFERLIDPQHNGKVQIQYTNPISRKTFRSDIFVKELQRLNFLL